MADPLSWGTLGVAAAALVQPWAIVLFRAIFRQASIDIYETGSIEVGYSSYGPTIALHGTLRASHRDQFVRNINVSLTKAKDLSIHLFDWGVFRTQKLTTSGGEEGSVELPYGFMLTTVQPHRYNIMFFDSTVQGEMRPHITKLQEEWNKTWLEAGASAFSQQPTPALSLQGGARPSLDDVYEEFADSDTYVTVYTALDRMCYWEPGKYQLIMEVETARPIRVFRRMWLFELSETDSDNLRRNSVKILHDACGRGYGLYSFAYVAYQSAG